MYGDNVLVPIWSTPFSHVADKARLGLGLDHEEAASWVTESSGTALGTENCYLTNRGACTAQSPPLKDPNGDRRKCNSLSPTRHKSLRLPTLAES